MIFDGNKYIHFELTEDTGKTQSWIVVNKTSGYHLGLITWYSGWRQYVFRPDGDSEYNYSCLDTINDFIKLLNKEHRVGLSMQEQLKSMV